MKDLTQGSIASHIAIMAPQIFAGMILMMLCGLIDLYFVAGLGEAAIAGVGAAGNAAFLINAFTQILSVGTVSMPVSAGMARSWSQSVHAGPRASLMRTPRAWTRPDSERSGSTP